MLALKTSTKIFKPYHFHVHLSCSSYKLGTCSLFINSISALHFSYLFDSLYVFFLTSQNFSNRSSWPCKMALSHLLGYPKSWSALWLLKSTIFFFSLLFIFFFSCSSSSGGIVLPVHFNSLFSLFVFCCFAVLVIVCPLDFLF